MKKKEWIWAVITMIVFFSVLPLISAGGKVADINNEIKDFLSLPINENSCEYIEDIDQDIAMLSSFEKNFLRYKDEYALAKGQNEEYINNHAIEISNQIEALEAVTEIKSETHRSEIEKKFDSLLISESSLFERQVKKQITNYGKLENLIEDYEVLLETYKVDCSECGGDGYISCDNCGGKGKKLVTWYSQGDWGSTSYSSYECTSCGGRGKKGCGDCVDGGYYVFS